MRIGYKHKKTGVIISLDRLKQLREQNSPRLQLARTTTPFNLESSNLRTEVFTFVIDEIPFSEEFELIYEKENDFTYDEVCFLEHVLFRSDEFASNQRLAKDISKKLYENKKNYHELRYSDWN